jgi:hypothetical protein
LLLRAGLLFNDEGLGSQGHGIRCGGTRCDTSFLSNIEVYRLGLAGVAAGMLYCDPQLSGIPLVTKINTVRLAPDSAVALQATARMRGVSVPQMIREAVAPEIKPALAREAK